MQVFKDFIFEDNHLLVVNKPSGYLSQPDGSGKPDILTACKNFIKNRDQKPGNVFLGLLHRLDRNVGGVMVLAKTSKAASRISEQIKKRSVKKRYLVVVNGNPRHFGLLENYLKKYPSGNKVIVRKQAEHGFKYAKLSFENIDSRDHFSLLLVDLHTGRPHQIRAQLADAGYPVWGDQKYGSLSSGSIALFSYQFELNHPVKKVPITFKCLPPDEYPWTHFKDSAFPEL